MIVGTANKLQAVVSQIADSPNSTFDARELMAKYTTDLICEVGFGISMDSLNENNSQFIKLGRRIFYRSPRDAFVWAVKQIFPDFAKGWHLLSPEIEKKMVHLVNNVLKEHKYKYSGRNDFIDLLLEIKEAGAMVGESLEKRNPDGSPRIVKLEFDDVLIRAQVFVFYIAGFETSSASTSFTLHLLAFNPECQEKVHKELDRVLAKHDNKITYDSVKELLYLEMAFYEAMRMYPSVGYLFRKCCSPEYTFPELGITINEGVSIVIPVQAMQNDEQYFPKPHVYDPERFHPEVKNMINKFAYLPFGEGPRVCAGLRLGVMQSLAGLAAVLHKFTVEPAASSLQRPIYDPRATITENVIGGLPLRFRKRKML